MLQCSVCGEAYSPPWRSLQTDANAICPPCFAANFSGNLLEGPTAREALEAYVDVPSTMTPRQAQAIARLAAVALRQAQEDT